MTPSERIKKKRADLGMTQEAFAQWLGVVGATVRSWEQEINPVPDWAFRAILRDDACTCRKGSSLNESDKA